MREPRHSPVYAARLIREPLQYRRRIRILARVNVYKSHKAQSAAAAMH